MNTTARFSLRPYRHHLPTDAYTYTPAYLPNTILCSSDDRILYSFIYVLITVEGEKEKKN